MKLILVRHGQSTYNLENRFTGWKYIYTNLGIKQYAYKNKTGYMISKYGMTMTALGISEELRGEGVAANTIWPAKPIKSLATINNNLGNEKHWRKPDIIADAILEIVKEEPRYFTGNQLIDEQYLRSKGMKDFTKYRCVKNSEPPNLKDIFLL